VADVSYDDKELSHEDSAPVELYQFLQGSTYFRYTTSATTISALSQSWLPRAIQRSNIGQSGEMPKETLTVKLPVTDSLAATFIGYSPDAITTLTLYRTHGDDLTNYITYWKGRVATAKVSGNVVSLECEPVFSSLRRMGLYQTYQRTCRHALYGEGCRLDADDYAETATVTAVDGPVLTITEASGWTFQVVGGTFKAPDGTIRMIVDHDGTSVTLMRPIKSLAAAIIADPGGFEATAYPGCDRSPTTCDEVFDNLANFGGFPGIPKVNPMGGGNAF
jgi:uncharacterized phage protein (TIGR02218 family)